MMSVKSKNIHVLPTEKPSRLMIDTIENKLYLQPILHKKTINVLTQNIYITSDEEIKEGDWFLYDNEILKSDKLGIFDVTLVSICKKIILTTDQDLIKDGVQAIDDDFLEWFVKNPSCKEVEVYEVNGKLFAEPKQETLEEVIGKEFQFHSSTENASTILYGAIIPKEIGFKMENGKRTETFYSKEEPTIEEEYLKDELKKYDGIDVVVLNKPEEPKQETLEEAAKLALLFHNNYEKLAPSFGYETRQDTKEFDFKSNNGRLMVAVCSEVIKWQQEQDKNKFSEEDMMESFIEGYKQRAEKSDLIFDNASRMYAIALFKQELENK